MKKLFTVVCAALVAAVAFADRTASRGWVSSNFAPTNLVPRVEALESVQPSDFWDDDDFQGRALDWANSSLWYDDGFREHALDWGRDALWYDDDFRDHALDWGRYSLWYDDDFRGNAVDWANAMLWNDEYFRGSAMDWARDHLWTDEDFRGYALDWLQSREFASFPSGGSGASTHASGAVQLGEGENEHSNTLQFREWTLVGDDGKIPVERLAAASVLAVIKGMSEAQIAELKDLLK